MIENTFCFLEGVVLSCIEVGNFQIPVMESRLICQRVHHQKLLKWQTDFRTLFL